jgi:hypothetical protein
MSTFRMKVLHPSSGLLHLNIHETINTTILQQKKFVQILLLLKKAFVCISYKVLEVSFVFAYDVSSLLTSHPALCPICTCRLPPILTVVTLSIVDATRAGCRNF